MRIPLVLPLLFLTSGAFAQTVADLSSWREVALVKDQGLRTAARRSCALMRKEALAPNLDGSWQVTNDPFTHLRGNTQPSAQFCAGIPFHGQPRPASPFAGRSGFLVGPDLVLTAAHGIPNDLAFVQASFQFVFDWHVTQGSTGLLPPSLTLPAANVYTAAAIVAHGPSIAGSGPESFYFDFLLIRLDRPVTGDRGFMRLRRTASVPLAVGDAVATIGHPDGLPAKIATAGYASQLTDGVPANPWGSITLASSPALPGSSGGMYYNTGRDWVESVATFGGALGFLDFGGCIALGSNCGSCEVLQTSGTPVHMFSQFVPALELQVFPLSQVSHASTAGTAYSHGSTHFVDLSFAANGPTDVRLVELTPLPKPQKGPQVSARFYAPDASGRTHLYPGERGQIEVLATVAATVPAGTYTHRFAVVDARWGFRDVIEHRFVVAAAH